MEQYVDWHRMIDECKKAKENYIAIEAAFQGITNYDAVKKYLQRLKKKGKRVAIHVSNIDDNKSSGELICHNDVIYIYNRHKHICADTQSDLNGFSYADYCNMCSNQNFISYNSPASNYI